MLDEALSWIFAELVGNFFFRLGRFYLRVLSIGQLRLETPSRFAMFVVSLFGLLMSVLLIALFGFLLS
jgi:hypothetical protein